MTTASWPDHLLTLGEWDGLPEDAARRCELVEGVLLVVPRAAALHQRAMVRLASTLDRQLPRVLTALADVEVLVHEGPPATVRAPDVIVTTAARAEQNPPRFASADVLLAVEIISPGTGRTDRVTKLADYADAGIEYYWLIALEQPARLAAYRLAGGTYEHVAGGDGMVTVPGPVPVTVDLQALTSRH